MTEADKKDVIVNISTTMGDIKVLLYGDTPKHRDNFLKLVNEGFYNGTLFHRVINEFMIQAGDPESKGAPMRQEARRRRSRLQCGGGNRISPAFP